MSELLTVRALLDRFRRLEETAMALFERLAERDGIPADELLRQIRTGCGEMACTIDPSRPSLASQIGDM